MWIIKENTIMNTDELAKEQEREINQVLYDVDRDPAQVAEERGLKVIFPKDNELFIDIDSKEGMVIFEKNFLLLHKFIPSSYTKIPSQSGGDHCHIIVDMSEGIKDESVRALLQACLGSDPTRELLAYARIFYSMEIPPTCLFVSEEFFNERMGVKKDENRS
jgi:hypothetical protein